MYVIDVEGSKAFLLVSPSGQSMLIDAGIPGSEHDGRDAKRIVEACQAAGVKKIDYMVVSHYDADHVGGVPALAERMPIVTFVDHGENVQMNDFTDQSGERLYGRRGQGQAPGGEGRRQNSHQGLRRSGGDGGGEGDYGAAEGGRAAESRLRYHSP